MVICWFWVGLYSLVLREDTLKFKHVHYGDPDHFPYHTVGTLLPFLSLWLHVGFSLVYLNFSASHNARLNIYIVKTHFPFGTTTENMFFLNYLSSFFLKTTFIFQLQILESLNRLVVCQQVEISSFER